MFKERLKQYGGYVAEIAASLNAESDIVYSPIEPLMLPWPWCRGRIAHFKVPRYVQIVSAFPMTVTGKVQKFKLREQAIEELDLASHVVETA